MLFKINLIHPLCGCIVIHQTRRHSCKQTLPPDLDMVATATARANPLMWVQLQLAKRQAEWNAGRGLKRIENV